jgi:hypothetical protein
MKMKKSFFVLLLVCGVWCCHGQGETSNDTFKRLPLVVTLNFNAISTPFHKMKNNFKNVGVRVGTEVGWNSSGNLYQSFNVGYYRNRLNGDGLYINSEFIYRPVVYNHLRMEFKIGPGLADIFLPSQPYQPDGHGNWKKASNPGKPAFQIHTGIGICYEDFMVNHTRVSSFLQYEMVGVVNYNQSVPVLPTSYIHAGSRIRF